MSTTFSAFLETQFSTPVPTPQLNIIQHLKATYPESQHVSAHFVQGHTAFPLSGYLDAAGIKPSVVEPETHTELAYSESRRAVYSRAVAGVTNFTHDGTNFRVYKASWAQDYRVHEFYHFVFSGADGSAGRALVDAVYKWGQELKEEIWVFESGAWYKSPQLYKAVRAADWDDVVLDDAFKDGLRRDTKTFFESKEAYASLGITWKRGILLLGPPGNGKTESIKALLHEAEGVAPLYVKSLATCKGPEEGVQAIFEHARAHTPCILILEDLDSMLVPEVRSLFLNELDGLADNEGILTIATTNHPERIDDAILNRPSRFDVKYEFTLPDAALRRAFAVKWLARVNALAASTGVRFDGAESVAVAVSEKTEGWSYAFLKELFVSFLLRMAHDRALRKTGVDVAQDSCEAILLKQVDQLAAQILTNDAAVDDQPAAKCAGDSRSQARRLRILADMMKGNDTAIVTSAVNF